MSKSTEFIARRILKQSEKHNFPNAYVKVFDHDSDSLITIDSCGIKISDEAIYQHNKKIGFSEIREITYGEEHENIEKADRSKLLLKLRNGNPITLTLPAGGTFYGVFSILLNVVRMTR